MAMSAQDQLKIALREAIAPQLRAHGLKGTERTFSLPSPRFFAQMGVQASTSSTRELAKFTVNLQVIDKVEWSAAREERGWLPAKPSPNTVYAAGVHGWRERIGLLVDSTDTWWTLDAEGTGRDKVCREVVDAIVNHGLPAMHARMA